MPIDQFLEYLGSTKKNTPEKETLEKVEEIPNMDSRKSDFTNSAYLEI
jgi:hypothetical protein